MKQTIDPQITKRLSAAALRRIEAEFRMKEISELVSKMSLEDVEIRLSSMSEWRDIVSKTPMSGYRDLLSDLLYLENQ